MPIASLLAVITLVTVHLLCGRLWRPLGDSRSRWLSFGGGVSVAYVILHLIPELSAGQDVVEAEFGEILAFFERHVYLLALIGLIGFYGLEHYTAVSRRENQDTRYFHVHIAVFAVYNAVIGYLLVYRDDVDGSPLRNLALFTIAMAWHFTINDYAMRQHDHHAYEHYGRWVLAAAVIGGWLIGVAFGVSEPILFLLLALLGGSIVLNVLKEELPEERSSHFWAFALGAGIYAIVLILL
jgi:hypothetical protein